MPWSKRSSDASKAITCNGVGTSRTDTESRSRLLVLLPRTYHCLMMIYAAFKVLAKPCSSSHAFRWLWSEECLVSRIYGLPFSISAGVGFIALSGIAVLNGVVLVNYFNQLRHERGYTGDETRHYGNHDSIASITYDRSCRRVFGFLTDGHHWSRRRVQRPLAAVVIGGIVFVNDSDF